MTDRLEDHKQKYLNKMISVAAVVFMILLLVFFVMEIRRGRYQQKYTTCKSTIGCIASALELYKEDHGNYPPAGTWREGLFKTKGEKHPYMPEPLCESKNTRYGYVVDADLQNYTLYCNGEHYKELKGIRKGYPQFSSRTGLIENK